MEFFGLQFSYEGMSITEQKLKALLDAERPETKTELRSNLGFATYCGRFIKNLAGNSGKLWHLCKKGVNFEWKAAHQIEFDAIKENVIGKALGCYNHQWTTVLEVDASPIWGGSATPPIQPKGPRG